MNEGKEMLKMFGRIIILGAEVLLYYKSAEVMYKIAKNTLKLVLMFNKNKPEEDIIETHFAD